MVHVLIHHPTLPTSFTPLHSLIKTPLLSTSSSLLLHLHHISSFNHQILSINSSSLFFSLHQTKWSLLQELLLSLHHPILSLPPPSYAAAVAATQPTHPNSSSRKSITTHKPLFILLMSSSLMVSSSLFTTFNSTGLNRTFNLNRTPVHLNRTPLFMNRTLNRLP